jgi:hypothetical protein
MVKFTCAFSCKIIRYSKDTHADTVIVFDSCVVVKISISEVFVTICCIEYSVRLNYLPYYEKGLPSQGFLLKKPRRLF